MMNRVMIVAAVRTPLGAFCGQLETLTEQQLGALAMQEAVRRAAVSPEQIDEVVVGVAKQTSRPSNAGRHTMLLARFPDTVPAYTVHRQSASGLQAILNGYWAIRCGDAGVVLAGGMESMSQIPFELRAVRFSFDPGRNEIEDAIPQQETGAQPESVYGRVTTAQVAENLARKYHLSDTELASFADESLRRAREARKSERLAREIVPVPVKKGRKEGIVAQDELVPAPVLVAPPADGAAMCVLASQGKSLDLGLSAGVEIVSAGIAAVDPRFTGLAVVEASRLAIGRAGVSVRDLDVIAMNEMSAAECLAVFREWQAWGLSPEALAERVNPGGGALATGNAWGAMGSVLATRAVHDLSRYSGRLALVAAGAEGGQGMAMVLRRAE
jgi:acetyl-CoA C-acetyltransferase